MLEHTGTASKKKKLETNRKLSKNFKRRNFNSKKYNHSTLQSSKVNILQGHNNVKNEHRFNQKHAKEMKEEDVQGGLGILKHRLILHRRKPGGNI